MKILKLLVISLIAFIGIIAIVVSLKSAPEAPDLDIELTQERIERGEYLVKNVSGCAHCHSPAQKGEISWAVRENFDLSGGPTFGSQMKLPGELRPANLTPHYLKDFTDGEIYRAIVNGWGLDGRAMFPIMPYTNYSQMDTEDIYSIIAYLRSVPAVESEHKESKLNFPVNIIAKMFFDRETKHQKIPPKSDKVAYGKYLVNASGCGDCHTPMPSDGGPPIEGEYLNGGHYMNDVDGKEYLVKNITPHEDGLKNINEEEFIQLFKRFTPSSSTMGDGKKFPANLMPWEVYAGMTRDDLSSIFAYLQTVEPKPDYSEN